MTIFAQPFLFQVKKKYCLHRVETTMAHSLEANKPAIYSNNKNIMENGYEENRPTVTQNIMENGHEPFIYQ